MDARKTVKNIAEKFEHLNKDTSVSKSPLDHRRRIVPEQSTANLNVRSNIKRTPAFRRDKVPCKNEITCTPKSTSTLQPPSIVTDRVHQFDKLTDVHLLNKFHETAPSSTQVIGKLQDRKENGSELCDTLTRVLRSPLPSGPPPKKPPRCFISKPNQNADFQPAKKFVRSKTAPEIMLKKLENALIKHQNPTASMKIHENDDNNNGLSPKSKSVSCFNSKSCFKGNIYEEITTKPEPAKFFIPTPAALEQDHIYEDIETSSSTTSHNGKLYYLSTPITSLVENASQSVMSNPPKFFGLFQSRHPLNVLDEERINSWMKEVYSSPWVNKGTDGNSDSDSVTAEENHPLTIFTTTEGKASSSDDKGYHDVELTTLKRKDHAKRITRQVSAASACSSKSEYTEDDRKLFECLVLVDLNVDASRTKVPYIKMKHPPNCHVPDHLEHMCFPDARDWSNEEIADDKGCVGKCYSVVLTDAKGVRKYAYCRRITPEGMNFPLPLTYCILTRHKASNFYFSVLEELESRHGQSAYDFSQFLADIHRNEFPGVGRGIFISDPQSANSNRRIEILKRPLDSRLEDLDLAKSLQLLPIPVFSHLFCSLLLERNVILLSSSLYKLSVCVNGLEMALFPFQWQHTLVSIVPSAVISICDVCSAPTPYLLGILKPADYRENPRHFLQMLDDLSSEVIVADVDEKKIIRKVGDENTILPKRLNKGLRTALQSAHSSELRTNNLLACEAFTRLFVELVGHYRRYMNFEASHIYQKEAFKKEAFVKEALHPSIVPFLEWFVETASFSFFIESKRSNEQPGLFEQRCNEFTEEMNKLKNSKTKSLKTRLLQIGDKLGLDNSN